MVPSACLVKIDNSASNAEQKGLDSVSNFVCIGTVVR